MRHDERGSIAVMTIGFLVLLGLLSVVVVNASDAYLERQELSNLADGAALAAADGLDQDAFYTGGDVDLGPGEARALVGAYLRDRGVRVVGIDVVDDTITLRLERRLDLALVPPGWFDDTTVGADATAQLRE